MRPFLLSLAAWAGSCLGLAAAEEAAASHYAVGFSKIDITPAYPVRLNGFGGRREESEGVTQPIFAKALAISELEAGETSGEPVVVVTVDNLGIRLAMVEEVSRRLMEKTGLKRERFMVTFSHSHTTPKVNGASDTIFSNPIPPAHQAHIDRYTSELTDWMEEAALQALANRKPARISWAVGSVGFAKNRRMVDGPVDHDLPTLVVRDPEDDSVRGIYVSYACHCVTLSDNKISGDWAGFAQAAIEGDHPGAICLTSIGCGSDANPDSGVTGGRADLAAAQGDAIRAEVGRLLARETKPIGGELRTTLNTIDLPLNELPAREEFERLAPQGGPAGYSAQWHLAKLDRGEKLMTSIRYPIQSLSFGDDLAILFLAGEVCVDYSIRLKREFDRERLWINAYTNDFCSYIPSERLVGEGGYGGGAEMVYFGVPATLKAGLENLIVEEVHRQLSREFSVRDDPQRTGGSRPLSPAAACGALQLPAELRAELVAAEPLVVDPVAIDFGPDGRLWVCEMRDYPEGMNGRYEAGGRISVLEDTNGDGRYDRSSRFAEGLPFPTGVRVWRKGILVCAAPEVLYLEDTDGDGVADHREVVLNGFATHNYQARVNSIRPGLDGWMYAAVGLFGGEIESARSGATVHLSGRDFRFDPDTGVLEPASGNSQQGRDRDDWGRWFGCTNGTLIKQYPIADHYLRRNPHLAPPPVELDVLAGTGFSRLHPAREDPQLFKLSGAAGGVTSACGIGIYRDTLLGEEYAADAFTCEPVNLVVHRSDLLARADRVGMTAAPPPDQAEFISSVDRWFRPVEARTGPDGALWIVDMCRFVIEHPRWIPEETLKDLDVRAGATRGRIYRILPRDGQLRPVPRFDQLDLPGLVAALDSPNGTVRDLVTQLIDWRSDPAAVPALVALLNREDLRPESRVHAMCVLERLDALGSDALSAGLRDPHWGVRTQAARLCETRLSAQPALHAPFLALGEDPNPEVRMQFAASLGEWTAPGAGEALAALLLRTEDPYVTGAALSSALPHLTVVLNAILPLEPRAPVVPELLSMATATYSPDQLEALSRLVVDRTVSSRSVATFLDALRRRKFSDDEGAAIIAVLRPLTRQARKTASDQSAEPAERLEAMTLLAHLPAEAKEDAEVLMALLEPNAPLSLQSAAIAALGRLPATDPAETELVPTLLTLRASAAPTLRAQILDTLMSRNAWAQRMLDEFTARPEEVAAIDPARRQTLLDHPNPAIAKSAAALFGPAGAALNPDRARLVASYQEVADRIGAVDRGEGIFRAACAACHELDGIGIAIGPDLATLSDRSVPAFLVAILDPNRAVLDQYVQYVVTTQDGRTLTGLISGETASSILLKQLDGSTIEILRTALASLNPSGRSLMPDGLESLLGKDEMADLIAFLNAPRAPRKEFPGSHPAIVRPDAEGVLRLSAQNCDVYGRDIILEETFHNLGNWHSPDDRAVWTVHLEQEADFTVLLDYACDNGVAGNRFLFEGGRETIRRSVTGTGQWSDYVEIGIGSLTLPAGESRLTFRSDGAVQGALLDLRTIRLDPLRK